jgi:hypothetical protein
MNFLNMFSDEAPISNNGYRSSLYTDPSIKQGVDFLNYEKDIKNSLTSSLRLISQTDGSNLSSGQVISGKIYEGMETASAAAPATADPEKQFENEVSKEIQDKDIEDLKMAYNFVNLIYNDLLENFEKDYEGGIANTPTTTGQNQAAISTQRQQLIKAIESIQGALGIINVQISDVVKKRSKVNIKAYYTIMDEIRDVKYKIIDTNNKIEELTKIVDPVSAVAEREETHILSKQRYYMYIFWFIITAIVLYVMVVNMINPNSSFSILVVCIIILVCIFVFIMYNNITGAWYNDIKDGIRGIHIPRIGNIFNFDPLVSIKYTS